MKQGWEIKKLGEVAHISPSKSEVKTFALNPMDMVSFLPMEDLTIGRTFVHPNKQKTLSEVEGSYTYFKEGDVLLAKVTPCFENGKLAIAKGLCNNIGFGSSEYIVIRPMQHIVNSQYLIYLLQTNAFRNGGRTLMIGACGLKRLPKPYVANYELPVPSLAEQERIVEILDREFEMIDALKANAEQNLQHAKDLFQAALKQELQPKEGWETKTIGEICTLKSGNSNANNTPEGTLPFVKVGDMNIQGNEERITCSSNYVSYTANMKGIFPIGTVIFPKRGGAILTNKKRITSVEICCDLNIMGVYSNGAIIPELLYFYFLGVDLSKIYNGAAIPQINNGDIAPLTISFPKILTEEHSVVNRLIKHREICKALEDNYKKTIALCDDMKQALLRKAFNGEL